MFVINFVILYHKLESGFFFVVVCMDYLKTGLSGVQTDTTSVAAANGMLSPFSVQNLLTMAALGQPQLGASNQQISAQLTNAAPSSMCKYFIYFFL